MTFSEVHAGLDLNELIGLVFGLGSALFAVVLVVVLFIRPMKAMHGKDHKYILEYGKPAEATVLSVSDARPGSRTTINNKIYMKVELEVKDPVTPYLTAVEAVLSDEILMALHPGKVIAIKVHPEDYLKVAVNWKEIKPLLF